MIKMSLKFIHSYMKIVPGVDDSLIKISLK